MNWPNFYYIVHPLYDAISILSENKNHRAYLLNISVLIIFSSCNRQRWSEKTFLGILFPTIVNFVRSIRVQSNWIFSTFPLVVGNDCLLNNTSTIFSYDKFFSAFISWMVCFRKCYRFSEIIVPIQWLI